LKLLRRIERSAVVLAQTWCCCCTDILALISRDADFRLWSRDIAHDLVSPGRGFLHQNALTTTPHNNLPFHFLFADALYDSLQRFTFDYPASVSHQTLEPFAHQLTELHVVF
jgi:hypothetical protein